MEKVHPKGNIKSFDVGKYAEHVIQADISKIPLENGVLDVGVFSLSLMGTNFPAFLREANRVLKKGGKLFVAEVVSRFENGDCKPFLQCVKDEAGFSSLKCAKLKDFFYLMVLQKDTDYKKLPADVSDDFTATLKPCLYKRR